MLFEYYWGFLLLIVACAIFSGWASMRVHRTYNAYQGVTTRSHMTGYDTAVRLLRAGGVRDISVQKVRGTLSDHYHPKREVVNLSESTYGNDSIAAVAVAAHEIGHVMQKKKGYFFYKLRTILVPVVNFGSYLALPLVLVGLLLDLIVLSGNSNVGFYLAMAGVVLYGGSTLFMLVTLPVELNASKRAKKMLLETGIIQADELPHAEKMLSAAAMTYVASLVTSLVYFLRFFVMVLMLFGRNRRD